MSDTTLRQATNARRAVSFFFILLGTVSGAWAARIPAVKHDLGLSDGQLSYGLLAIAAGLVIGMRFAGRLTDRLGSARVITPAAIATALAVIPPGYAPTLPLLITTLFLYGLINASLDVSMNAHGVEVERAYGRPIMSSFHGMFSIGGLIGAGIGGLFAWLGLSAATTLTATGIPLALLSLHARRHLLPTQPAAPATTTPARTRWSGWIVLMGVVAFAGLVGEGAAVDWTAVYLFEDLGAPQSVAALGFAVFSTAMTAGRFAGDHLAQRLGPVRLVRYSGLLAALGLATALLIGRVPIAIAGFALFGLGLATIVPQVFSAAGNHDPARAGEAIAQVATVGYAGLVAGPAIIGGAAEIIGLPGALAIPALLAAFMAASAGALRPRTPLTS
ncbi:MFS transporter [Streptosporangium roseum]|uniref:Major facilitator transporter n=1 Tax=Streptosporangium roseum (strain ATCC 12428 / DSM 43021 / JCM 3005 / KCTC 9067 / NCIMB 10171 / NRRL 2505 / NI 9100) TaxID=479432 RepID=D2B1K0_STRRD|nr:MFS transporter [Streptosporangium roseum]ACZ87302.1 major facilitator transporter [Streptosporangium roseum DSM 43021]